MEGFPSEFGNLPWQELDSGRASDRLIRFESDAQELCYRFMNGKAISFSYRVGENERNLTIRVGKNTPLFRNVMRQQQAGVEITPEGVQELLLRHIANLIPIEECAKKPIERIKATFEEDRCAHISMGEKEISYSKAVGRNKIKAHNLTTELSYLPKKAKMQSIFEKNSREIVLNERESQERQELLVLKNLEKVEAMVDCECLSEEMEKKLFRLGQTWDRSTEQLQSFQRELQDLGHFHSGSKAMKPSQQKIQRLSSNIRGLEEEVQGAKGGIFLLKKEISQQLQIQEKDRAKFEDEMAHLREKEAHFSKENQQIVSEIQTFEEKLHLMHAPCGDEGIRVAQRHFEEGFTIQEGRYQLEALLTSYIREIQRFPKGYREMQEAFLRLLQELRGENISLQCLSQEEFEGFLHSVKQANSSIDLIQCLREIIRAHAEYTGSFMQEGQEKIQREVEKRQEKLACLSKERGLLEYKAHLSQKFQKKSRLFEDVFQRYDEECRFISREDPILSQEMSEHLSRFRKEEGFIYDLFLDSLRKISGNQGTAERAENEAAIQAEAAIDRLDEIIWKMEKHSRSMQARRFDYGEFHEKLNVQVLNCKHVEEGMRIVEEKSDQKFYEMFEGMCFQNIPYREVFRRDLEHFRRKFQIYEERFSLFPNLMNHASGLLQEFERGQYDLLQLQKNMTFFLMEEPSTSYLDTYERQGIEESLLQARSLRELVDRFDKAVSLLRERGEEELKRHMEDKGNFIGKMGECLREYRLECQHFVSEYAQKAEQSLSCALEEKRQISEMLQECDQKYQRILSQAGIKNRLPQLEGKIQEIKLAREQIAILDELKPFTKLHECRMELCQYLEQERSLEEARKFAFKLLKRYRHCIGEGVWGLEESFHQVESIQKLISMFDEIILNFNRKNLEERLNSIRREQDLIESMERIVSA